MLGVLTQDVQGAAHLCSAATAAAALCARSIGTEFEGYTWPERFAVLTTRYDFGAEMGCSRRAYVADPDQWVNLY